MTSAHNLGQSGSRLFEIGFVRREPTQGCVCLRHNARQGLIDLMRNRGGEFACGCQAIHLSQLGHGAPRRDLCTVAAPVLTQQENDRTELEEKDSSGSKNVRPILLPRAELTK